MTDAASTTAGAARTISMLTLYPPDADSFDASLTPK
jgi:hypothetical protein